MFKTLVSLTLLAVASVSGHAFTNCGKGESLTVNGVTLTPDPPVPGQTLVIAINGTFSQQQNAGTASLTVLYSGVQVQTQTVDLCKFTNCPIPANEPFLASNSADLPSYAPSGAYETHVSITDSNKNEIGCLIIDFSI